MRFSGETWDVTSQPLHFDACALRVPDGSG